LLRSAPRFMCSKVVKTVPFTIECKFTVAVTKSKKKITKSVNVRKRADK